MATLVCQGGIYCHKQEAICSVMYHTGKRDAYAIRNSMDTIKIDLANCNLPKFLPSTFLPYMVGMESNTEFLMYDSTHTCSS